MLTSILTTAAIVLACSVAWMVLAIAVLDLVFWLGAPRRARARDDARALHGPLDDAVRRA